MGGAEGRARRPRRGGPRGHGGRRGQDADRTRPETGKRRWSVEFSWPTGYHANQLHRVGSTLILIDRIGDVHALDIGTGRERWTQTPAGDAQPSVATPGVVAFSVCRDRKCHAEARSIADGALVWEAPVDPGDRYLGSPDVGDPPNRAGGLWPASHVLLRTPGTPARYQVRDVATGRVVLRGGGARESAAVVGKLLVRAGQQGPTTATDLTTGREAWRFEEGNLTPMRAARGETATLGMPDGGLLMSTQYQALPEISIGDELRVLDPRTGKLTVETADVDGFEEELAPTLDTPITAESVADGPPVRAPALRSDGDVSEIYADGRVYRLDDYERNSIGATRTQVGWEASMSRFAGGSHDGVEVRDRRSGKRLVRYVGDGGAVVVRSAGERLVIADGQREYVVAP